MKLSLKDIDAVYKKIDKKLDELLRENDYMSAFDLLDIAINRAPSVPAVPLEPLARWIVENLDPRCDCNYCINEDTDFEDRERCNCPKMSEEQVKEALTKWMEEQDAAEKDS